MRSSMVVLVGSSASADEAPTEKQLGVPVVRLAAGTETAVIEAYVLARGQVVVFSTLHDEHSFGRIADVVAACQRGGTKAAVVLHGPLDTDDARALTRTLERLDRLRQTWATPVVLACSPLSTTDALTMCLTRELRLLVSRSSGIFDRGAFITLSSGALKVTEMQMDSTAVRDAVKQTFGHLDAMFRARNVPVYGTPIELGDLTMSRWLGGDASDVALIVVDPDDTHRIAATMAMAAAGDQATRPVLSIVVAHQHFHHMVELLVQAGSDLPLDDSDTVSRVLRARGMQRKDLTLLTHGASALSKRQITITRCSEIQTIDHVISRWSASTTKAENLRVVVSDVGRLADELALEPSEIVSTLRACAAKHKASIVATLSRRDVEGFDRALSEEARTHGVSVLWAIDARDRATDREERAKSRRRGEHGHGG